MTSQDNSRSTAWYNEDANENNESRAGTSTSTSKDKGKGTSKNKDQGRRVEQEKWRLGRNFNKDQEGYKGTFCEGEFGPEKL